MKFESSHWDFGKKPTPPNSCRAYDPPHEWCISPIQSRSAGYEKLYFLTVSPMATCKSGITRYLLHRHMQVWKCTKMVLLKNLHVTSLYRVPRMTGPDGTAMSWWRAWAANWPSPIQQTIQPNDILEISATCPTIPNCPTLINWPGQCQRVQYIWLIQTFIMRSLTTVTNIA